MNFTSLRRVACAGSLALTVSVVPAAAQTLVLNDGNATTLVVEAMRRPTSAPATCSKRGPAAIRYTRRALFKFDTDNTIAQGTPNREGNADGHRCQRQRRRRRAPLRVPGAFVVRRISASWTIRNGSTLWGTPGGDVGARYATASVPGTNGTKVTFDVTALVNAIVRGDFGGSRYTRILLIDEGPSGPAVVQADPLRRGLGQLHASHLDDYLRHVHVQQRVNVHAAAHDLDAATHDVDAAPHDERRIDQHVRRRAARAAVEHPSRRLRHRRRLRHQSRRHVGREHAARRHHVQRDREVTGWGNQDQPEVYKSLLQQKTGKTWYYVFAQEFGDWSSNGKGNLILSTYPIT